MAGAFRSGLQTTDPEGYADCNPEQNPPAMRSRRGPKTFPDGPDLLTQPIHSGVGGNAENRTPRAPRARVRETANGTCNAARSVHEVEGASYVRRSDGLERGICLQSTAKSNSNVFSYQHGRHMNERASPVRGILRHILETLDL